MWDFGEGGCLARGHGFSNVDSKLFEDVCIVISQIESSIVVQWKKIFKNDLVFFNVKLVLDEGS